MKPKGIRLQTIFLNPYDFLLLNPTERRTKPCYKCNDNNRKKQINPVTNWISNLSALTQNICFILVDNISHYKPLISNQKSKVQN
jgi:hypothetical protein